MLSPGLFVHQNYEGNEFTKLRLNEKMFTLTIEIEKETVREIERKRKRKLKGGFIWFGLFWRKYKSVTLFSLGVGGHEMH